MTPAVLAQLWTQIDRTADRTDARVIFRTAGEDSPLPRKLPADLLAPWVYLEGGKPGPSRPGPVFDLWRLPCLCAAGPAVLKAAMPETTPPGRMPALMDQVYRHQRYIYDVTRKYYLFGRDRLIRELDLKPGEHVVEIGCGTARNLIRIARRYPGTQLYGLDASQEMLKTRDPQGSPRRAGRPDHAAHGYAEQLTPRLFERRDTVRSGHLFVQPFHDS